jgi:ribosomal-protein-serine acetyltransferase
MSISKGTPQKEYRTARLLFQARLLGHAGQLYTLIDSSREHLRPWMPWEKHTTSVEDSYQYLQKAIEDWNNQTIFDFSVFELNSGKMVGSFGLHTINWNRQSCELGYWLGEEFQGRGFATECVKLGEKIALEIGLHRIVITCDRGNHRSQQVARRNGYRLEANFIDHAPDQDTMQFVKFVNAPK